MVNRELAGCHSYWLGRKQVVCVNGSECLIFLWRKLAYEYDQMRFTILEEIKSTLPRSLFHNYYSQIKSNVGF